MHSNLLKINIDNLISLCEIYLKFIEFYLLPNNNLYQVRIYEHRTDRNRFI